MGRTCPKNSTNVYADVLKMAEMKFAHSVRENKVNQNQWHAAVEELKRSQDDIWVQKSGEKKGSVVGIPKKITAEFIRDYLKQVADGRISVAAEEYDMSKNGAAAPVAVEDMKIYTTRNYGDSIWVLLAALYRNHRGFGVNMMSTQHLHASCGKNNPKNHQIVFDHRTSKQGVWKAMDGLVKGNWVVKRREDNGGNSYGLSETGYYVAHALFTKKFHPDVSREYTLIEPKAGFAANPNPNPMTSTSSAPNPNPNPTPITILKKRQFADFDPREFAAADSYDLTPAAYGATSSSTITRNGSSSSSIIASVQGRVEEGGLVDPTSELRHRRVEKFDPYTYLLVENYRTELGITLADAYVMVDTDKASESSRAQSAVKAANTAAYSIHSDNYDEEDEELALAIKASMAEAEAERSPFKRIRMEGGGGASAELRRPASSSSSSSTIQYESMQSSPPPPPSPSPSSSPPPARAGMPPTHTPTPIIPLMPRTTPVKFEIDLTGDSQPAEDFVDDDDDDDDDGSQVEIIEVDLTGESQPLCIEILDDSDIIVIDPPHTHTHARHTEGAKEIWLVVDHRERKSNALYNLLLNNARDVVPRLAPFSHVTRATLSTADFQWCLPGPTALGDNSDDDALGECPVYPMLIERKTLSDIIERSATTSGWSGDAAHFKQERAMRYCKLSNKRAFLLLEGELTVIAMRKIQPRVGNNERRDYLAAPDVISGVDDVIACLMGIVARNVGSRSDQRVFVLQSTAAETSLFLAALTLIASHETALAADCNGGLTFKSFNHTCRGQSLKSDMAELHSVLHNAGISTSFCRLIERRFGTIAALAETLVDAGAIRGPQLLTDLAHGGANISYPTPAEDMQRHNREVVKVYSAIMKEETTQLFSTAAGSSGNMLEVQTSRQMHTFLDCETAVFPEHFSFNKLIDDPNPDLAYCQLVKTDRANGRASAPVMVVSILPALILSTMIEICDSLGDDVGDLELIAATWASISLALPSMVRKAVESPFADGQVAVCIIEAAGHSSSQGARGRLATAHNKHLTAAGMSAQWVTLPEEFATGGSTHTALLRSVQKVNTNSNFLIVLFIALLSFRGVQVVQTRSAAETGKFVLALMHEVHRQGLMDRAL